MRHERGVLVASLVQGKARRLRRRALRQRRRRRLAASKNHRGRSFVAGIDLGFSIAGCLLCPLTLREQLIMKPFKTLQLAVAAAALLAAGAASAERPENLAGTTWTVQTNRDTVQLVIETQGGSGATGAAICRTINGHFNLTPPEIGIRGWYCPSTGRIHFVHRNLHTGDAVRVFTGNVSDNVIGQPLYMAGTMTVLYATLADRADLGEYNFSATR
jgi:hypothetical protein